MKCSLGISNFLEEISSLCCSIVFLYFFALITEEGFLISPCYSLGFYIQMGVSFLLSFVSHFSPPIQCHEPLSIVLQALCLSDLIPWIYLSLPLYNPKGFDLCHTWMVPTFFNLSLNLAVRNSWSEPHSAPSLVFADCVELLHLWLQRM